MDRKTKQKIFPEIKDWTNSQNKLRNTNPNKLNYIQWFWFHPSAYKLLSRGFNVLGIIAFTFLTCYMLSRKLWIFMFIGIIFGIGNIFALYKKLKSPVKNITFYDIHMREYI